MNLISGAQQAEYFHNGFHSRTSEEDFPFGKCLNCLVHVGYSNVQEPIATYLRKWTIKCNSFYECDES